MLVEDQTSVIALLYQIVHLIRVAYAFDKQRGYRLYTELLIYKWLIFYYINLLYELLNCH